MARSRLLLLESPDGWRLGPAGSASADLVRLVPAGASSESLAEAVHSYVEENAASPVDLVIAIHATSVVAATVPAAPGRRPDRRELLYSLEEFLPFDAEQAVADFCQVDDRLFGVATRQDRLQDFIERAESTGVRVMSVFPTVLGAVQERHGHKEASAVVWCMQGAADTVEVTDGRVCSWTHTSPTGEAVRRELCLREITEPDLLIDPDSGCDMDVLTQATGTNQASAESMTDCASRFAARVIQGRVTPWIELRRGALANGDPNRAWRRASNRLLLMVAVLLVAFSSACLFRAHRYSAQAARVVEDQRVLFADAFPGRRIPPAHMSRLRSEHARLVGSRQTTKEVTLPVSAIEPTVRALKAVPQDLDIRLTELRVEDGRLNLHAEIPSFADASRLAQSLEQNQFEVTPDGQEQLDGGRVSTRLHGNSVRTERADGGQP